VSRPAEVVNSKVEETQEDALTSAHPFSLDYDNSTGRRHATALPWRDRRFGPGESASIGGDLGQKPFDGSLEEFVQHMFNNPFESSEVEKGVPATRAPGAGERLFSWLNRGSSQKSPAKDATSDNSNQKQDITKLYESLARGVQEV
jgi:hypothetical protein